MATNACYNDYQSIYQNVLKNLLPYAYKNVEHTCECDFINAKDGLRLFHNNVYIGSPIKLISPKILNGRREARHLP